MKAKKRILIGLLTALLLPLLTSCKEQATVTGISPIGVEGSASVPSDPTALSVSGLTSSSLTLSWTDNATNELIYEIEQCSESDCTSFEPLSNSPRSANTTTISVTGLSSATTYRFRVRAANSQATSAWLTSGNVSTTSVGVAAPTSLTVTSQESTSLAFSWVDNATNEATYVVESCAGVGCTSFAAVAGSPFAANTTTATLTALTSSSTYRIRVRAESASAQSAYLSSSDLTTAPAAPSGLTIGTTTQNSVSLTWTDNSSDELIYEIEKCVGSGCTTFVAASSSPEGANTTAYTESGLIDGTIYRFRVRATNSNGSSAYITSADVSTLMAPPSSLTINSVSDTAIVLGWTDNSALETGFDVERCVGAACSSFTPISGSPVAANSVVTTIGSLTDSTTYRFRVRAAGTNPSAYLTSGDISTAPAAPTGMTTGAVTYNSIAFTWTDNATNETSYAVERCSGASCSSFSSLTTLAANASSYTDTAVSGSTSYTYRVRAVNAAGGSTYLTSNSILTASAPVDALACTSPNTATIDFGAQLGVAATARGIWSDVKYIPSGVTTGTGSATGNVVTYSGNAGVAYVDVGGLALKYSFTNSSGAFQTETVYGDAVANITYVRLGYLSNAPNTGLPIIFFTNGAVNNGQIMMAVRSTASLTATGTWTVAAIDSNAGTTNRALELSISPIDQVGLVYQGVTLPTANNIRFVYCTSNCQSASNYVAQGTGGTHRINIGATATQTHLGIGWCQMSSGIYNPAVVYGASATSYQLAVCNTGGSGNSLTSCAANTGWTRTTATMAATGASGITSDLYLDSSIVGDVPKIMIKDVGGSQMKTFITNVGCNSIAAGSTYTQGSSAIVGSGIAAYANSWFRILKAPNYTTPANERFFVVANDGTASMRWSASTTSSFNGAWQANAASPIHTVTLGTAGASVMGADLNTTTKQIITAYGTAAGTFNITLGVVNDYSSPGDPAGTANMYFQLPVEGAGHMQLNAAQINNTAIASTSLSRPAVAWVDFSSGAATTGRLKYSLRTGSAASNSSWTVYTIPGISGTMAPQYPSLAFDHNDRPWIGYYDNQGATGRFVLVTNSSSDGSGAWTSYAFPVIAAGHGASVAQPAANMTAVAMSYSGGVATPVMIVIDNGTNPAVKASKLTPSTGTWSSIATIETLAAQGAAFLSADFSTSSNTIVVAYQNLTTGSVRVKYAASTDGGATWPTAGGTPFGVSAFAQGEGAKIRWNEATGRPGIAYYDRVNNRLFFAACSANCTGSSSPTFTGNSSSILNGIGISGLSVAGNVNLLNASLTYSAAGDAYVVFNSGALDIGALRMIDNVGGTMPSAFPTTVVAGANGAFSGAAATNGGIPWNQNSVRMPNGVLGIVYVAPGGSLKITTCGD